MEVGNSCILSAVRYGITQINLTENVQVKVEHRQAEDRIVILLLVIINAPHRVLLEVSES